jgi:hypothetical protein
MDYLHQPSWLPFVAMLLLLPLLLLLLLCQILEVSPEQQGPGFRVHGSMRVVDQDSGTDLDPSGQLAAAAAAKGA